MAKHKNMGWESGRVLEGIFQFGEPLNIWKIELYDDRNGDLGYFRVHMQLDDDPHLVARLKMLMAGTSSYDFQRLILMEGPQTRSIKTDLWMKHYFYKASLYSLQTDYQPSYFPFGPWKGWTLGIAFDKTKENVAAVSNVFGAYRSM
jgi:hypothetical protein